MHSGPFTVGAQATFQQPVMSDAPDCSAHHTWPWPKRLASAAGRRMHAWWNAGQANGPSAVEAAVAWLNRQDHGRGLPALSGGPGCAGMTAAMLATLLEFGQSELVQSWSEWLLASQLPDGSFPRADGAVGSPFNTSQALVALLELNAAGTIADTTAARRAAQYLATRLVAPSKPAGDLMLRVRVASELCCLPALAAAAQCFAVPEWQAIVDRIVAHARRVVDWRLWDASLRLVPFIAEAWLSLGERDLARDALRGPSAAQRRDGAVPGDRSGRWGDYAVLAQLAALWYRLGDRRRADLALTFVESGQSAGGSWGESWGRERTAGESAWAVKHYLDSARWQVASSFTGEPCDLPTTISADDGRLLAAEAWAHTLGGSANVADVGCGPGRFLRELIKRYPAAKFVGIDPSAALLERLPREVESRRGGLLRIPAGDGEFDGALAVESLEHSLLPQRAVAELCRIVRPSGRVLIIDKHAAQQRLSLHQSWERWFQLEEVAAWLAPYCRDIDVRPIAHGPTAQPGGLFFAWEATRLG
jgi:hypothetical protein